MTNDEPWEFKAALTSVMQGVFNLKTVRQLVHSYIHIDFFILRLGQARFFTS